MRRHDCLYEGKQLILSPKEAYRGVLRSQSRLIMELVSILLIMRILPKCIILLTNIPEVFFMVIIVFLLFSTRLRFPLSFQRGSNIYLSDMYLIVNDQVLLILLHLKWITG